MSVRLIIQNEQGSISSEKCFPSSLTFALLKERLENIFGFSSLQMDIWHFDEKDRLIQQFTGNTSSTDSHSLAQLGFQNYHLVKVKQNDLFERQTNLQGNSFHIQESIPKYEITRESYINRPDSFYQWKQSHVSIGGDNTNKTEESQSTDNLVIGMRCFVTANHQPRLATIRWIGNLENQSGLFVGLELDNPVGNHDGSFNGKRYFSTLPNCAIFTRPSSIQTADLSADDELLMEEL